VRGWRRGRHSATRPLAVVDKQGLAYVTATRPGHGTYSREGSRYRMLGLGPSIWLSRSQVPRRVLFALYAPTATMSSRWYWFNGTSSMLGQKVRIGDKRLCGYCRLARSGTQVTFTRTVAGLSSHLPPLVPARSSSDRTCTMFVSTLDMSCSRACCFVYKHPGTTNLRDRPRPRTPSRDTSAYTPSSAHYEIIIIVLCHFPRPRIRRVRRACTLSASPTYFVSSVS
jgi:hypothetical protein